MRVRRKNAQSETALLMAAEARHLPEPTGVASVVPTDHLSPCPFPDIKA